MIIIPDIPDVVIKDVCIAVSPNIKPVKSVQLPASVLQVGTLN